ncbi:hypothetical protein AGDE_11733 [Angomonas deanei]|uniref:Uncharacterized protein n=1 Tax=Angomonas deanei TaxID=59799 RepID=A0A7G2CWR4_9TRYP|nr:hypothetical protein AGDE_11733 [Angomonas deanei]CAD2222712.1 hypothetical protein, conserved [Angomonas deanei]|eukprot:EPY25474.1 hypothetical protein AGDE_11733 [Angomonas deanei]
MKFIEHLKANPEDGAPEKSNVLLNHPAALEYVCTEVSAYISATISHLSLAPLQLLGLPSECQPVVDGEHSLLLQRLSDCLPPYTQPYDLKHVFLDLDLSILGSKKFGNDHTAGNNSSYVDCYADLIAKEYIPVVGEKTFREKRAEFLEGFLAKPQWFKTPYFYFQMEETARENVRAERKYLQMTASSHTD